MNLKHKLEHAAYAWLKAGAAGSLFQDLPLTLSYGGNPDQSDSEQVTLPPYPSATITATLTAEEGLPGVSRFQLQVQVYADAALTVGDRRAKLALIDALLQRMVAPPDDNELAGDTNPEGSAFCAFANQPETGEDLREDWRKPLHVYDLREQGEAGISGEGATQDTLTFRGVAQTMNREDDA